MALILMFDSSGYKLGNQRFIIDTRAAMTMKKGKTRKAAMSLVSKICSHLKNEPHAVLELSRSDIGAMYLISTIATDFVGQELLYTIKF